VGFFSWVTIFICAFQVLHRPISIWLHSVETVKAQTQVVCLVQPWFNLGLSSSPQ